MLEDKDYINPYDARLVIEAEMNTLGISPIQYEHMYGRGDSVGWVGITFKSLDDLRLYKIMGSQVKTNLILWYRDKIGTLHQHV